MQEQPWKPGTTLTDVFPVQVEWREGYLLGADAAGPRHRVRPRRRQGAHPFRLTEPPHLHAP